MYTILDLNFSGDLDYFEEAFTIKLFFVSITLRQFIEHSTMLKRASDVKHMRKSSNKEMDDEGSLD